MDINDFRKSLGERIRKAREHRGCSQDDLGKWIDKKKGAVSKYERGDGDIDTRALAIIAQRTGTTVEWLISGNGPGPGIIRDPDQLNKGSLDRVIHGVSEPPKGLSVADAVIMRAVIEGIEEYLEEEDVELRPNKKADLVLTLFEMCIEEGKEVDKATIVRLVRLAA